MRYVTIIILAAACGLASAQVKKMQTIQAVIHTEPWKGWGGGEPTPDGLKGEQAPEKFTRIPAGGGAQTFSGKVVGLKPDQKAEIGIVSLVGTHWLKQSNYEWFQLERTHEFSITSQKNPQADKTLVVRADGESWTYLRAEFEPGEGGKQIELTVKPSTKVAITMEDALGNPVSNFRGEVFNAYMRFDDAGKELRFQRFGNPTSKNGAIVLDLPAEHFGVLLFGDRVAPYYQIIDPREANHFHFKMLAASRIRGTITRDGKPAAGEQVYMVNDAAPLSASIRKTDARGVFDVPGRVPGTHHISIGDYQSDVEIGPGETAELQIELSATASAPAAQK